MTGWPADWAARKAGQGCALCGAPAPVDDEWALHVALLPTAKVALQRRSPVAGYATVIWRGRHVAEPTELTGAEAAAFWADVVAVSGAVEAAFSPAKVNIMVLGNTVPHLHAHVVPRPDDDPAPGAPLPWDALLGAPARPDAALDAERGLLRTALAHCAVPDASPLREG